MDIKHLQTLIEQFMRITNTINELHSENINFDNNISLTLGEIHLIESIGKHQDTNVTEISKIIGNTKGAVSQMAKKLEKKGLINKKKKGNNNKEIILELSERGKKIFLEHENLHDSLYKEILSSLNNQPLENIEFIKDTLSVIEKHTKNYKKKYQ